MKKRIGLIFVVLLVALLVATLVACDPDPTNPLGPENPTQSTYTVTFDLNGAAFEYPDLLAPITGVKYGDTIPEPLYNGKSIVLQKEGYEFKGWTANSSDFVFGEGGTKIVSNTTIRAKFEAKKYYHILDIYTTFKYNASSGKYDPNKDGHASVGAGGAPSYSGNVLKNSLGEEVKDDAGVTTRVPDTNIVFADGAIGENTNLYSTYNTTSPTRVSVPSRPALEGEEKDNFCFWYYMADTYDEDGNPVTEGNIPVSEGGKIKQHPVQFSEWAAEGATDVAVRSVSYTYDEPLTLYAMFESDLPYVTVEYYESENSEEPLNKADLENGEYKYRLGKNIPESEKFLPTLKDTLEHKTDYDFHHWYFVYYTENEDEEGDPIRNEQKFAFDTLDENGKSTNKDATSPMDAAHDDDIPAGEQNFRPVTLKLYANWVKMITINTADEYTSKLSGPISALLDEIAALKEGEAVPETAQNALNEFLTATIKFAAIDFGGATLKPLFDEAHPFAGIIDGGIYTEGEEGAQVLGGSVTLSNATVEGKDFASLFGYVNGTVKNLKVQNITVKATAENTKLYLGALASVSGGSFARCEISDLTFELPSNAGLAYIGGLAGQLNGTANDADKGSINECSATLTLSGLTAKGLFVGGLVGEIGSSTTVSNCTSSLTLSSVSATEGQDAYSGLKIGGIAGNSVANVSACDAALTVDDITANSTAFIGGLLGQNVGSISRCHATLTTTSLSLGTTVPQQLLAVGGFIGRNEGDIINSYADVTINFTLNKAQTAYVGGFVGLNSSARTDSSSDKEKGPGAINRCYSAGTVTVSVDASVKTAEVYVGGMIGLSKHSKFANNFTLADVALTYATEDTSLINAGFLFGALDKDATFTSGYYANEGTVTVNGKAYKGSDYAPNDDETEDKQDADASDDSSDATEQNVFALGTPRDKADFANKDIVFGTKTEEKQLGWTGGNEDASKDIWELKDDASAPTLVGIGFPQEQPQDSETDEGQPEEQPKE